MNEDIAAMEAMIAALDCTCTEAQQSGGDPTLCRYCTIAGELNRLGEDARETRAMLEKKYGTKSGPVIVCNHPEWMGKTMPLPAVMVGPCEHNMTCPVCGFGWGTAPCGCEK